MILGKERAKTISQRSVKEPLGWGGSAIFSTLDKILRPLP